MPVLPSGQNMNNTADNMAIICCIGTTIDEGNFPTPDNVLAHKQQHQGYYNTKNN